MQRKLVLFFSIIFILSTIILNGGLRPEWKKFGEKYKNKYPGDPGKKAIYLAGLVGETLAQYKIDPNYDALGRARAYRKHGSQGVGTCGDIAEIMRNVFTGAGFKNHQMFKILVKKEGLNKLKQGWVFDLNLEHYVFGVVVNRKPIVFEAWAYGGDNGSFGGFYKSIWNGMGLDAWLKTMKKHNYSAYSYGDDNFRGINIDDICLFLRKIELTKSGRLEKKPRRIRDSSLDSNEKILAEYRSLYPRWLRKNDALGSTTVVKVNGRKVEGNKYYFHIETTRIAEHGNLKGKRYVSGSNKFSITIGEMVPSIRVFKSKLGIK